MGFLKKIRVLANVATNKILCQISACAGCQQNLFEKGQSTRIYIGYFSQMQYSCIWRHYIVIPSAGCHQVLCTAAEYENLTIGGSEHTKLQRSQTLCKHLSLNLFPQNISLCIDGCFYFCRRNGTRVTGRTCTCDNYERHESNWKYGQNTENRRQLLCVATLSRHRILCFGAGSFWGIWGGSTGSDRINRERG